MSFIARGLMTAIIAGSGHAALAQTEVKLGYALAPASHYGVAAEAWEAHVEDATEGAYDFVHFPSSGLGGEREVIEGLQLGTVETTIASSGTLSNFVPEAGVFDIPFLFRDFDHARAVLDGPVGQEILASFEDVGLKALAWGEQGFRHITNNRGPINTAEDLAGLKLRTMENPTHITAFETLGAAPTPMAWPEVIGALQQGTIDGQENPLTVITSAKLSEVQEHLTLSGHVYAPTVFLVSLPFWEGLSEDEQQDFQEGAIAAQSAMRAYVDEIEASGLEQLKAEGMSVNELSAEERAAFREALAPAYARYAEEYGSELIDRIVAAE